MIVAQEGEVGAGSADVSRLEGGVGGLTLGDGVGVGAVKQEEVAAGPGYVEAFKEVVAHGGAVVAGAPEGELIAQRDGLEGGFAEDGDVGGPFYLAVEGLRDVGVVVAGGDEGGDGGQALQLLPEEVAGVQSGTLMLVEVTADGNGVDLLVEGEIDEAAEGVAELLAAVVGDVSLHAATAESSIKVDVSGVEYGGQAMAYLLKGTLTFPNFSC